MGDGAGQLRVVDRAQGVVAGDGGAVDDLQAGDVAALLVDGDEDVLALGAELRGEGGELAGRGDVAAEEPDGGEAVADLPQQPLGGLGAGEAGLEDGEGVTGELVTGDGGGLGGHRAHPFTAPEVRPAAILDWMIMKKMTTGRAIIVEAAISAP